MTAPTGWVAVRDVRGDDGYAPIESYGILGNGRGVALVCLDGSVDWWALPALDDPPVCAAMLDPGRGGTIELHPLDEDAEVRHRYLPGTNLLETEFRTGTGRVRVTDGLNSGNAGALPWTELARRVEGLEGHVELRFRVRPGDGLRRWEPWIDHKHDDPLLHAGGVTMAVRCSPGVEVVSDSRCVGADVSVGAGERVLLGVVGTDREPLFLANPASIDSRLDLTRDSWLRWSSQVRSDGPRRDQVVRSLLAIKTLLMARTGAIAAAATTSMPESPAGGKNWDYRYSWVRDAALTVDAMSDCGLEEEVHAAVSWLLTTIRRQGPDVHVMYTLTGGTPTPSHSVDVPGYRDIGPVVIGNDAVGQVQLGVYGDLFGTVSRWVFGGHVLDVRTARELADLADQCADLWRHDDSGIWELGERRPYTTSKINCWRALSCAAELAEAGHIAGSAERWSREAGNIREWVHAHCWSEREQSYTFYAGTDELDASVLLGAAFDFDRGPRMSATIDAVTRRLGAGPLVYRYTGVDREEATFLACAYWRVQALALVGRRAEAERLMSRLDAQVTPLGLLAEMAEAGTGVARANFPQALSHLALVDAAATLHPAAGGGDTLADDARDSGDSSDHSDSDGERHDDDDDDDGGAHE